MSGQIEDWIDQVGPGWADILRELDAGLQEVYPSYEVGQIKEKFGTLRIYLDYGILDDTTFHAAQALVSLAESKSAVTCEDCGQLGRLCQPRSWYLTLCESCEAKSQAPAA